MPQPMQKKPTEGGSGSGGGGRSASGRSMLGEAGTGEMYVAKGVGREHSMSTVGAGRAQYPKAIPGARGGRTTSPTAISSGASGRVMLGAAGTGETSVTKGTGTGRQMHAARRTGDTSSTVVLLSLDPLIT